MFLTQVIPEAWRPYAKTVVAFIIGVIGLLVSLLVIDDKTGVEITQAITSVATLFGVYSAMNLYPQGSAVVTPTEAKDYRRGP